VEVVDQNLNQLVQVELVEVEMVDNMLLVLERKTELLIQEVDREMVIALLKAAVQE
jgi:hypothetical protein